MKDKICNFKCYLISFLKREWDLSDYPIDYVDQGTCDPTLPERRRYHRWRAFILGWNLIGSGESRAEAYEALRKAFETAKVERDTMPRPGTEVPVEFASDEKVSRWPELRDDFIGKVLGLDWGFISDESSLWDFHSENDNKVLHQKIGEVYGVDVSYIESGNLAEIFETIMDQIHDFPEDFTHKAIRLVRDARDRHNMGLPEELWNPYDV